MTLEEINSLCELSAKAFFQSHDEFNFDKRRNLMVSIAKRIDRFRNELIEQAANETNLSRERLNSEIDRTIYQWTNYAKEGIDLLISRSIVNEESSEGGGKGQSLQKTYIPLGPVLVFGAANFPFAYSCLGGDVSSAIAAGCSVIVKAHPGHPKTSLLSAEIIAHCFQENDLNPHLFLHVEDSSINCGQNLVRNKHIAAVGFTGSFAGGTALQKIMQERNESIPFYAEMSSVNPVFILPGALKKNSTQLADKLSISICTDAGQFCTQPGILFLENSQSSFEFLQMLGEKLNSKGEQFLLNQYIADNFKKCRHQIIDSGIVKVVTSPQHSNQIYPGLAICNIQDFIKNENLQNEVFGPFSLAVMYQSREELLHAALMLKGQLTASLHAEKEDEHLFNDLLKVLRHKAGRIIKNHVPTGVRVASGMHHGGPFPSSSDPRFTSVGSEAVMRFVRPISYQNFPLI